jgi:hypothetical protein
MGDSGNSGELVVRGRRIIFQVFWINVERLWSGGESPAILVQRWIPQKIDIWLGAISLG